MPNLGSLSPPHGLEDTPVIHRPGLVHLVQVGYLVICVVMSNSPYMPNLGSLSHPHVLEEAPVANQPGPGHLGDVA